LTFLFCDLGKDFCDCVLNHFDGAPHIFSQCVFDFCEDLFDWVEVSAIGWQEEQSCTHTFDCRPDCAGFVTSKIVRDDEVSRSEAWQQVLFDIGKEAFAIDGAVEDTRRCHFVTAKGTNECQGFSMAVWHATLKALAFRCPIAQRYHVGLDPGFINEDEARRIDSCLIFLPPIALSCDIRPLLFGGVNCFF
jgi:hypothetical protein